MRSNRLELFSAAQMAAALGMFPTLYPPGGLGKHHRYVPEPTPYHRAGHDTVLMDWDLPKGKRAKRRARGRRARPAAEQQTE